MAETELGKTETVLGLAETRLEKGETKLGKAERVLGLAETKFGKAEMGLRKAVVELIGDYCPFPKVLTQINFIFTLNEVIKGVSILLLKYKV